MYSDNVTGEARQGESASLTESGSAAPAAGKLTRSGEVSSPVRAGPPAGLQLLRAEGAGQRAGDWSMTSELSSALGLGASHPAAASAVVQRKASEQQTQQQTALERVRALLDQVFVPEGEVIALLSTLSPAERGTVLGEPWYRQRMVRAFNFAEMSRAVTNLRLPLATSLEWLEAASVAAGAISYHELKPFIVAAPEAERRALANSRWQQFFTKVCTNTDIVDAVIDLRLPLEVQLGWIEDEGGSMMSYADVQPLVKAASRADLDKLKTSRWQSFFTKVCDNVTIYQAVVDLKLPLELQLGWLESEVGSVSASISYSDLKPLVTSAPQGERNKLKTARWRSFFTKVCDNTTIVDAVRDLSFDPLTRVEWILEEGNAGGLWGGGVDAKQIYQALRDQMKGEALTFIELASLDNWNDKDRQRIREIMDGGRDDRPTFEDKLGEEAKAQEGAASALISNHTRYQASKAGAVPILNHAALGRSLAGYLSSNPALVREVLDLLTAAAKPYLADLDDDVALHALEAIPEDARLKEIAESSRGRELLLTMVHKLFKGVNLPDEEKQQKRVMEAVAAVDAAGRQGGTREVEVISFLYGGQTLDAGGAVLGGFRGHTLLVVGDLVYSFEAGWSCGRTKAEYLAANTSRDGIGQILRIDEADAKILQENLNRSCGSGVYLVSGDICTGQASKALEKALHGNMHQAQNPQLFIGYLESSGLVAERRRYPKRSE